MLDLLFQHALERGHGEVVGLHRDDILASVLDDRLPVGVVVHEEEIVAGDDADASCVTVDDRIRAVAASREPGARIADRGAHGQRHHAASS